MKPTDPKDPTTPAKPHALMWLLASGFVLLAIFLTPSLLIELGPLRRSLTSSNPLTRSTAETTVAVARIALGLLGVGCVALLANWSTLANGRLARLISAHPITDQYERALDRIGGVSLGATLSSLAIGILYLLFAGSVLPISVLDWVSREDGIIEQATAIVFLVSSLFAAKIAIKKFSRRSRPPSESTRSAVWLGLLATFFFVCFGEEISWGQRILGFETMESIKSINVQGEANLHNLLGYAADHLFIAGVAFYGGVLPLIGSRIPFIRRSLSWLGIPVASVGLALGFLAVSLVHDWTIYELIPAQRFRIAELRELLTSVAFFFLIFEVAARDKVTNDTIGNSQSGSRS